MTLHEGCRECKHLHEDLSEAMMAYYKILNKFQLARLRRDSALIEKLDALRREGDWWV